MEFRKVTAIVRTMKLEEVEDCLKEMGVPGLSITRVKGYGEYANFFRHDSLATHARIEIFTNPERAAEIAHRIVEVAHTGLEGDGIVAVLPVTSVYRIRSKRECKHEDL